MRDFPTDPMRQHSRFIAALCDDMASGHFSLKGGKAERVMEICRQINETPREAGCSNKAPASNQ